MFVWDIFVDPWRSKKVQTATLGQFENILMIKNKYIQIYFDI